MTESQVTSTVQLVSSAAFSDLITASYLFTWKTYWESSVNSQVQCWYHLVHTVNRNCPMLGPSAMPTSPKWSRPCTLACVSIYSGLCDYDFAGKIHLMLVVHIAFYFH